MAWQDSHFGLSYDRPVETLAPSPQIPRPETSRPGRRGYFETMCSVISLILQLLRNEILLGSDVDDETIPAYKTELTKILADAEPHLQSEDYCFTLKDHIERLTLKLRSSYLVSEICRRSLKQNTTNRNTAATAPRLCHECIDSLIDTIKAFIELHEIIPHGSRSWIHLHSAISSAFLLSVDEGGQSDPNVWSILRRLEKVLSALTTSLDNNDNDSSSSSSSNKPDNNLVCHSPGSKKVWSPADYYPVSEYFTNENIAAATAAAATSCSSGSQSGFPFGSEMFGLDSPVLLNTNSNTSTGTEFLTGTLTSLRKIIAGFNSRKMDTGELKKPGSCCARRCC